MRKTSGQEIFLHFFQIHQIHQIKSIKKILIALTISSSIFVFSSCKKIVTVLTLAEVHIEGYPTTLADHEFSRLVSQKTNGRIKIEVHSGSELYANERDSIEALRSGKIAFARISTSPLSEYVKTINIFQLPFLFRNKEHMLNVLTGEVGDEILSSIQQADSGLIGLCFYDSGARSFYSMKPINSVDDLKNMRIRVQQSSMMVEMINILGGIGVTGIGPSDVYQNLQNGIIDAAENNWSTYESMGDYLLANYYNLDEHNRVPDILVCSESFFKSLNPKDAQTILECAKLTQAYEFEKWAEKEKASETLIRESGNIVIEYTPNQIEEFKAKLQPMYDKYAVGYENLVERIRNVR